MLKPHIPDIQLLIDNYQIFRSDRKSSKNGGALLYVLNSIPIDETTSFDDDICSGVVCQSRSWKCILISLYRPPNASKDSFANLLTFLDTFITAKKEYNNLTTFIFGDFNFPGVNWNNESKLKCPISSPSFSELLSFMDKHFLTQYVNEKTRQNNTLDLILTDDPSFVQLVTVENTPVSDHNLLNIHTSFFNGLNKGVETCPETIQYPSF